MSLTVTQCVRAPYVTVRAGEGGEGGATVVGLEADGCVVPHVFAPLALPATPHVAGLFVCILCMLKIACSSTYMYIKISFSST
jgi:hypothetical protein